MKSLWFLRHVLCLFFVCGVAAMIMRADVHFGMQRQDATVKTPKSRWA